MQGKRTAFLQLYYLFSVDKVIKLISFEPNHVTKVIKLPIPEQEKELHSATLLL